jgi:hypothetical protein
MQLNATLEDYVCRLCPDDGAAWMLLELGAERVKLACSLS